MRVMTGRRRMAMAAASAAALLAAAACGDDGGETGENGDGDGDVTISIHDFGGAGFGYTELVEQFEADHPDITVDYQTTTDDYDGEYRPNLLQQLDAGTAPDIAAVEEGAIGQFMALEDDWVDLAEHGLDSREADYPAWKWELGYTAGGKLAGLGTDVGGMGICYRTDRFEQAGLPTDREEVAALWPTWDDFVSVGEDFMASPAAEDAVFVDSAAQIFNVRMVQAAGEGDGTSYFSREDEYVAGESPAVQTAFDLVRQLNEVGAIGQFNNFSDEWNTAMGPGAFATMACPAWMTGVVEGNSGEDNAGQWDFTSAPGIAGNWGGAWLGVTANSEHPEEAAMLVDFLTSPEGQTGANAAVGTFPSAPEAQEALLGETNAYFNDAPVNQIVADSVAAYQPVFFGSLHSTVKQPFEEVLQGMVNGDYSVDEAFDEAVAAGAEAVQLGG